MLSLNGVTLAYPGKPILDDVSKDLQPGRFYGLVAPNGYGKTTLLQALDGNRVCLRAGEIACDGARPESLAYRRSVYYAQGGSAGGLVAHKSVRRHLELVAEAWGSGADVSLIVEQLGMADFQHRPARALSQGMGQLLVLGMALASGARYLLLDEPMNALDVSNVKRLSGLLRGLVERGSCILMSSHILGNIDEMCDEVLYIADNGITSCSGRSAEVYERLYLS